MNSNDPSRRADQGDSNDSVRINGGRSDNPHPGDDAAAEDTLANSAAATTGGSLIGSRVGDFQVMRKLGRGGMADVYSARQVSLGREVALKVLRSEFARDKDYIERFRREARAAAKLNHPNIVQVIDVGQANSMHFIAQELIDGENLRQIVERVGALDLNEAVEVMVGVASALEVASEAGITHRDIKPENIMRSARGIIKVADFGLARGGGDTGATQTNLTQAGLTLGTPRYMSPEQVQGQPVDVRSDLYSLGVTMYHLLGGRPPFEADDPLALALMHLHETPPPLDRVRNRVDEEGNPDLPEWLIAVVSRLMNKLPRDRFQSPSELLDAIRNEASTSNLGGYTVGTAAATIRLQRATDQARKQRRRQQFRYAAAILLPVVFTAVGFAMAVQRPSPDVAALLVPESVKEAETVQQQYLFAVDRNDEAGWRAVGEYFPPGDSAVNAEYYAKSMIQLARWMVSEGRLVEAEQVLGDLLRQPDVDRVYLAVALARQYFVLQELGRNDRMAEVKRELQTLWSEFESNQSAQFVIDRTLTGAEQLQLGLGDS